MLYIFNANHGRTVAKITLASQLFQFVFIPIAAAVDEETHQATSTLSNYAQSQAINSVEAWLNQYGNSRIKTHYDFNAEKFDESSIDMLFALQDNGTDVTFTQFGFRHYDDRNTLNFGLGYRQLDEHYLWGVNAFYDRDLTGKNDRASVGAEYFIDYLRINANGYFGLTNWHDSDDVWLDGNQTIFLQEKPADGVDIMMNTYLPDYPQFGVKLGYEHYFGQNVNLFGRDELHSDPFAVTIGLNHTPIPLVTWGVDHKQGKQGSDDTRIYLGLNYRFGETWENQTNENHVNTLRRLNAGRLDLVERNNLITLDYRRKPVETIAAQSPVATGLSITTVSDNALADGTDKNIIEAVVRDQNGQPLEGAVVIFKDAIGNTLDVVTTDVNGVARLERTSTLPGKQIISATLQANSSVVKQTSVNFTNLATLAQATLALTRITDNAVANDRDTNQLEATLLDVGGKALGNVNVNFVDDNGNIVATGTTNADGIAQGRLTSPVAGSKNITAVVAGTNIRSNTLLTTFIPVSSPQDAARINAATTIDGALANGKSTNTVTARVWDKNDQLLAGIEVEFLDENGKVIGRAFTNNQGIATIQIPSKAPGSKPITARIAGNTTVKGETTINFTDESLLQGGEITLVPGTNGSPADGVTNNTVEATVKDKNGVPANNVRIDFINTKTGEVIATGTTDSTGKVIGKITSTTPGDMIIEAVVSGSNPKIKSATVTTTFVSKPAPAVAASISVMTSVDGALANGASTNTVKATVRDKDNQFAAGIEVEFLNANNEVIGSAITDIDGIATLNIPSTTPGSQTITARVAGNRSIKSITGINFTDESLLQGGKITLVPGTNGSPADGMTNNTVEATVKNKNGDPANNVPIDFINTKTGEVIATGTTDSTGKVIGKITSTIPGDITIAAVVSGSSPEIKSATVTTTFVSKPAPAVAASISVVTSVDGALANGVAKNTVKATVRDKDNQFAAGIEVEFLNANNEVIGSEITDIYGIATLNISSTTPGSQTITARVVSNKTIKGNTDINFVDESLLQGARVELVLGTNGSPADGMTENTVEATVKDKNGTPANNVRIDFINTVTGEVIATGTTDSTGKVIGKITSTTPGDITIAAVVSGSNPVNKSATVTTTFVYAPVATKIASEVTKDGSIANGVATNTIKATVKDQNDKTLPNIEVEFLDTDGNILHLNTPLFTDTKGEISFDLTSLVAGAKPVTVRVKNKPLLMLTKTVTFIADSSTAKIASVTPQTSTLPADGETTTPVDIFVTDVNGNILANYPIKSITDSTGHAYTGPFETDANGKVIVNSIPTTTPSTVTVTATLENGSTKTGNIIFEQSLVNPTITITPDDLEVVANGSNTTMARGILTDKFANPIINQEVKVVIEGVTQPLYTRTDTMGNYEVNVPARTTVGPVKITAETVNLPTNVAKDTSITFIADLSTAKIASVTPQTSTLTADGEATTPIEIFVTDVNGNILANYPIESITDSTGYEYIGPFETDANGKVTINSVPTTTPSTVTVTATLENTSTNTGTIIFEQSLVNPEITIQADKSVIIANGQDSTIARGILTDKFGNPIANQSISIVVGEGEPILKTTDTDGKYDVPVPSGTKVGEVVNITATTVNLPTQISASTSVSYNGDVRTKGLKFEAEKSSLVANMDSAKNSSNLTVTVTDADGIAIINEEVTIVDKDTGRTYQGKTDADGKFIDVYQPYDSEGITRFIPGTDVIFEANFVNAPQEPKTDQLRLTYGTIQVTASPQWDGFVVGTPVEIVHTLQQRQNNIDLATGSLNAVLVFSEGIDLKEEIDYTITTSPLRLIEPEVTRKFESIVTITFLNTTKATEFLNTAYSFDLNAKGWDSESIDPNDYSFAGNMKEIFINP